VEDERYTILLVSEKAEKTRRIRLRPASLRFIVIGIIFIIIGGLSSLIYSISYMNKISEINAENLKMRTERKDVAKLIIDLQRIQEMDTYVRQSLGMPDPIKDLDSDFEKSLSVQVSYLENIPSLMPTFGFVTQGFSKGKFANRSNHTGLDIAASLLTPIKATADAFVVFSGWHHLYGNLIILSHGNRYFSLYGHNHQNIVKERDNVKRGQLIALMGESGVTSGPHLHFEIWKNGIPLDPTIYIPEYKSDYMIGYYEKK
tara:strand:+ start:52009 stop:52785 length:777 start_codon:yes stop_codon:yes gene_type:complete